VSCILYGVLPFGLFEFIAYNQYCRTRDLPVSASLAAYGRERGYHLPSDEPSLWCYWTLPFSYSYIQDTHWNVGFLNYYEVKQLPNFMLAMPVIIFSLVSAGHYLMKIKVTVSGSGSFRSSMDSQTMRFLPYCLHLVFLVIFGIFNVHIQVLTRMIYSSTPLIYFYLAQHVSLYVTRGRCTQFFKLTMIHFAVYFLIGTLLFSNFYPWT